MPKIQSPETFAPNQVLNAEDLQNHVDGAQPLPGFITEHAPYQPENTVAADDKLLISDTSDSAALKKVNASEILNSGLNSTFGTSNSTTTVTSVINGQANQDIVQTPNDGALVTGKSFTSIDGINVVVTSNGHGLQSNSLVDFTASDAAYSGQYYITVVNADSFSYVISQENPVAANGTLDYRKKGIVKIAGSEYLSGSLKVTGNLNVSGKITASNNFDLSGTANFTGAFQFNGSAAYALSEIVEESIPNATGVAAQTLHTLFTSQEYTKPTNEIWVVEIEALLQSANNTNFHYRITNSNDSVDYVVNFMRASVSGMAIPIFHRFYLNSSNEHDGTFVFRAKCYEQTIRISPTSSELGALYPDNTKASLGKFRIYKYKTA